MPGADDAQYECPICKDTELIFRKRPVMQNGKEVLQDFATFCECKDQKAWKRRFKQSMIPDEFQKANFENYATNARYQLDMKKMALDYVNLFRIGTDNEGRKKKIIPSYNFGLIASVGEQRLKELPAADRAGIKNQHNNFGIGKTHLQIAISKLLLKEGFRVLVVSDAVFINELMQAKRAGDEGEQLNRVLGPALDADVLIWDDIGKSSWTEARETMYYQIINERYRKQMPIIFNSNEDRGTLADKIGYAAASRLIGQCSDEKYKFLMDAEGQDWRLRKHG
ncbi:ATP-binding protein [Domibacillus iocasae]|uniref:DNA replication protein n=1 Tax=Domibacillus iocasae TaxID=1714016 RepID=A0A1E7DRX9_9BACI|nr:ATP-binding protein [Domibacillus iocasae]OES45836.1 DNA replication protein [Domibacillus iocasae]